ncbi:PTS fructose transporter subunit IIC [Enterococcus xiangfangensis]|uniref:Fructose-specific PTS transporter subunit EIIC n=1 Tax=Enterococcus xiangfangensis TaxID=1296537 RepID=A0ABU3FBV2_9ENTE|nr:fructose-specific PTS transporter subunit EIIC [Enterococcus xiangfangensis]MDT2760144.1 fructose-specific PTS transporter subunit EIIC [Enterococcus xiangfangensis]
MKIVGITACAAGIAHTYMAQAAIEEAAKELGMKAKVETQGTIGTENELTSKEIEEADLVIIAADINIDKGRFGGKKLVEIDTNTVLKDPKKVIQEGLQNATVFGAKGTKINGNMEIGTSSNKFVRYLMSGLTDMIPITIAAGLLLAIANAMAFHPDPNNADLVVWGFQETASGEFFSKLFDLGKVGFTLMIPIFAAGVARAIGDKPAVAPAFIAGYIINDPTFLKTETGAGFIGAILVGFGVGYLVKLLKKIPYPHLLKPVVPILIIPLVATFISFVVIYYLIGRPIAAGMNGLYDVINHVTVAYAAAPILYGAVLGGMMGVDMGGPINKTAMLVSSAIFVDTMNQFGPAGVNAIPQAATGAAIAVAPLGAGIATLLFKKYFTTEERTLGSSALVMGMVGVTEGAIPFAAANPSLIVANTVSSAISGALVASMGIQFYGGVGSPLGAFIGYTTGPKLSWLLWIGAILFASLINAFLYRFFLRKRNVIPKDVEREAVIEK